MTSDVGLGMCSLPIIGIIAVSLQNKFLWRVANVTFYFTAAGPFVNVSSAVDKVSLTQDFFQTPINHAYKCSSVDLGQLTGSNSTTADVVIKEFELQAFDLDSGNFSPGIGKAALSFAIYAGLAPLPLFFCNRSTSLCGGCCPESGGTNSHWFCDRCNGPVHLNGICHIQYLQKCKREKEEKNLWATAVIIRCTPVAYIPEQRIISSCTNTTVWILCQC